MSVIVMSVVYRTEIVNDFFFLNILSRNCYIDIYVHYYYYQYYYLSLIHIYWEGPYTVKKIENKIKYKIKTEQLRINQNEQHINNYNNTKWATLTYMNNKMTKLTKLFKNTDIKIAYKTNKNNLQKLNSPHNNCLLYTSRCV